VTSGSQPPRLGYLLGISSALLAGVWLLSLMVLVVVALWCAVVTPYRQPLGLAIVGVVAEGGFAGVARRRIRRAESATRSWWTVAVVALALPLAVVNLAVILATVGTILHR
jgi:hypothetical protein